MIYELEPLAYKCDMKPNEFWDLTYRDAKLYVESKLEQKLNDTKEKIIILDELGNKLINGMKFYKPKFVSLRKIFKDLFKNEQDETQTVEEQIRNLRKWN